MTVTNHNGHFLRVTTTSGKPKCCKLQCRLKGHTSGAKWSLQTGNICGLRTSMAVDMFLDRAYRKSAATSATCGNNNEHNHNRIRDEVRVHGGFGGANGEERSSVRQHHPRTKEWEGGQQNWAQRLYKSNCTTLQLESKMAS